MTQGENDIEMEMSENRPLADSSGGGYVMDRGMRDLPKRVCGNLVVSVIAALLVIITLIMLGSMNHTLTHIWHQVDEIKNQNEEANGKFPGMLGMQWSAIQKQAKNSPVNFYLWSPDGSHPQKWVDNWLTPTLQEKYGISVNRIPAVYKDCTVSPMKVVCDVQNEVEAGKKTDGGAVDMIWINGVNFANMMNLDLLYGPFATSLPNANNFDFNDPAISVDKGTPIRSMEFPFNLAQGVFIYDKAKMSNPPMTMPELVTWIKANPGKFTYSDPTHDFTGAAFVRTMFYHYAGGSVEDWIKLDYDKELYNSNAPAVWAVLNEIEPYLYKGSDGLPYYPKNHEDLRPLVGNETLWMDFSWSAAEATIRMGDDQINPWPNTMQGYIPATGTISDCNYLAIPKNSKNKEAALVAINEIGSAGAMFARSLPTSWATLQAFDPEAPSMKEWDAAFDYVQAHNATPTVEQLAAGRLPDMGAPLVSVINEDWKIFVQNA